MKHISITYHMYRDYPRKETAETCITLPMVKVIADDVLKNGADSKYLFPRTLDDDLCVVPGGVVYEALCRLSEMQGYRYEGFCIDTYYTGKTRGIYVEYNGVVGKWIDGGLWSKYGDKIGTTLHGVLETKTTRRGEFKKLLFCKELYWALDAEEPMIRRNAND